MCFLPINSALLNLHYCKDAFNLKITGTCGLDSILHHCPSFFFKLIFVLVIILGKPIGMKNELEYAKVRKFLISYFLFLRLSVTVNVTAEL